MDVIAVFSILGVAATFSAERPRSIYLRVKKWIDRFAGSVMGALGVQLMIDAGRTG
jgi:threonine/homoserine/homoserine lactone efflux protein